MVQAGGTHVRAAPQFFPSGMQLEQAAPAVPHASSSMPAMQVLPLQQPVGQLAAVHVGAAHKRSPPHVPPTAVQLTHAWPPEPQDEFCVPTTHVLPLQQPVGHVFTSHVGTTHAPPWHVCPFGQLVHACPPVPHEETWVPLKHAFPTQHPGQLPALHVGAMVLHVLPRPGRFSHACPLAMQLSHWPPSEPHLVASEPTKQVVPSQQPAQLAGVQLGVP